MDTAEIEALDRADMERLAAGQDAALNQLMDRHASRLFAFLQRMVGDEAAAADLAQETFVRVYRNRNKFRAGAKFTTWLYTIANNLARDHHRWRARHPEVSLDTEEQPGQPSPGQAIPTPAPSPNQEAEASERTRNVRYAVDRLPPDLRTAVILCELEELALAEAARILKTTPKAVESRLYRARKILRQQLEKWL